VAGTFLSTAFTAAGTIIITRLLGPDGYGIYTLAFVAPSIFLQFLGLGVTLAITRYSAFYLSRGEVNRAVQITRRGIAFLLLFGVGLALLNLLAAPIVESVLLKRTNLAPYTAITSIFIMATAATQAATFAFVGWGSIKLLSTFSVLQGVARLAIGPPLILLGLGVYGAVVGHAGSYCVESGATLLTLFAFKLKGSAETGVSWVDDLRRMIGLGLPAFSGGIASGLAAQYVTILLASVVTNTVIGDYQAAINVSVAITLVSSGVTTVLTRSFATLDGLKADIGPAFDYAVRYVSFLLTPLVLFLLGSAAALFNVLYTSFYAGGIILLQLTALSYLPVTFGLTMLPSFLGGLGYSRFTMFMLVAGAVSVLITGPILVIWLGLGADGAVLAILVSNVISTAIGVFLAVRYLHAQLTIRPLLGIIAAGVASLMALTLIEQVALPGIPSILLESSAFTVLYLSLVPLFRGLGFDDLNRLQASIERVRLVGPVMHLILRYERWVLTKSGIQAG